MHTHTHTHNSDVPNAAMTVPIQAPNVVMSALVASGNMPVKWPPALERDCANIAMWAALEVVIMPVMSTPPSLVANATALKSHAAIHKQLKLLPKKC